MPMAAMQAYLEKLPKRLAELKLVLAEAVSLPHMKNEDRRAAWRSWMQQANVEEKAAPVSAGVLKLLGVGTRKVKK